MIFEALEAGSVIEYEFGTTEPIDLYVLPEEEWTLLEAQMGWDYAYAEIETMRGRGSYAVPRDATWVIVFVNYNQKDISLVYHVTAESPAVPAASAQSNLEANAPRDSKSSEDTNLAEEATSPGRRASVETERPPMVQEVMQVVPTLVAATTVAVWLGRKGKIQ